MPAIISTATEQDADFVEGHEGVVTKAYRCPAGVITIGTGFTMRSAVFAEYWRSKYGHDLRMGDTITKSESRMLLVKLINEEYGAAVAKKVRPMQQHHFGGASSMSFNCGKGSLDWKWAKALAEGRISDCAELLRTTAITANGRTLEGLRRRRKEEASLIQTGDYGFMGASVPSSVSQTSAEIEQYQEQLHALGFYDGEIDGINGPKTKTAVTEFQMENGLVTDGIVGPATRAAIIRALDEKNSGGASAGSGTVAGGGAVVTDGATSGFDWGTVVTTGLTIVIVVAVVGIAFHVYRNRAAIFGLDRVPT